MACAFIQKALRFGALPPGTPESYCKIDSSGRPEESVFGLLFESDGEFYDYGFSAVLAERSVSSEWLYRLELGRGKRWAQQVILIATVPMLRRWVRVSRSVPMSAIGLTYTRRTSPERRIVFS